MFKEVCENSDNASLSNKVRLLSNHAKLNSVLWYNPVDNCLNDLSFFLKKKLTRADKSTNVELATECAA